MSDDKTTIIKGNTDIYKKITDSSSSVELFYQGKEYRFSREKMPISIGRNPSDCTLVSTTPTTSRLHCTIEVRDNQIGINDSSSNGTYIQIGRAETVLVKNSFYPLMSQGHISLGEPIDLQSNETIHYRVSTDNKKH